MSKSLSKGQTPLKLQVKWAAVTSNPERCHQWAFQIKEQGKIPREQSTQVSRWHSHYCGGHRSSVSLRKGQRMAVVKQEKKN